VLGYLVVQGLGFYWLVVNELTKQLNSLPAVAGRSSLAPFIAGVKGLAPVFFGLVFYRRLAGCRQAENSPKFGNGFGA